MLNQNHAHQPHTRQLAPHEQALTAWLDGAMQPSAIAMIWQLWLPTRGPRPCWPSCTAPARPSRRRA